MMDLDHRLSANFSFWELIRSETAERHVHLVEQQENPPEEVLSALTWLCKLALQPIRDAIGRPLSVSSGYRCGEVNTLIGGVDTSTHCAGEAADTSVATLTQGLMDKVRERTLEVTGKQIRGNVNLNFYLFAWICLNLNALDIDQVIHEYGPKAGSPAWIHISTSERQNKREILVIGRYTTTRVLTFHEALNLGV